MFAIDAKLLEITAPWREQCAWRRSKVKPTVRRFHQLPYRAQEWSRSRKLVARVEATALSTVRFIVTSLQGRSKTLYEKVFCARGKAENLIKDMKRLTRSDKTACSRWQANQFRLFLHVGAYWLLHTLRLATPKRSPPCSTSPVTGSPASRRSIGSSMRARSAVTGTTSSTMTRRQSSG